MTYLNNLTEEERKEILKKSAESRDRKREIGKELDHHWMDIQHWKELASKHGIKLPRWYLPADETQIRKIIRKLDKDIHWYKETFGYVKTADHVKNNLKMPAYAFMGICLEVIYSSEPY